MKYNSIGEQLIAKAKELDPSYKDDKFNDMSEAIDILLNNTGGGGIPVVEGTLIEEESTENTKYYTIPEPQTSPFILHSDIGYVFIDVIDENYSGVISANSYTWALYGGSETTVSFTLYSPASFYNINFSGNFPMDETSSVDVTFSLTDRYTNSICIVSDIDVTRVFLKDGNSIFGSFQTPIIHGNDGKYRYWYIDQKEGDTTNTIATIKCKVVNLDGGSSISSYPYLTGRINASDTQTSTFPKTDSETRVVTIENLENLDLSKLLNTRTIIVDADADTSEVFNMACGAYGETEGIGTYVSSISCDKKTNNLFFFYINMDAQTNSFIIKRKTIPSGGANTNIPTLPADANTKTYTLKSVNGVLTWSE